jgi:hypothetical protein
MENQAPKVPDFRIINFYFSERQARGGRAFSFFEILDTLPLNVFGIYIEYYK